MAITGLSSSKMADFKSAAQGLINKYDRNGDGKLSRDEVTQPVNMGSDSYSFTNRVDSQYVERTTVFEDTFGHFNQAAFNAADANHDGSVDADELANAYLATKDGNHDGKLGWWERLWMGGSGGVRDWAETTSKVETNRTTSQEYDPEVTYVPVNPYPYDPAPYDPYNPYDPGPTPPAPDPYRPAPPPVSHGPTPPAPSPYRPAPPSVGGGGGGVRPPAPSGRPTPPRVR